jgi:hypothetical protein
MFEGQFSGGVKNGQGTFNWRDGSKYIGDFRDNEIEG